MLPIYFVVQLSVAYAVTISNIEPRRDANGAFMDAHDGNILQSEDGNEFFLYALEYGNYSEATGIGIRGGCPPATEAGTGAGIRWDHNVSVWTSPDLVSWTLRTREALLIAERPPAIYIRPKVVHNRAANLYVLWINVVPLSDPYGKGIYMTASSRSPFGPFHLENKNVTMSQPHGAYGDFSLFVDNDGLAYNIYTVWNAVGTPVQPTHLVIEELSPDYLSSSQRSSPVFQGGGGFAAEAPALFYRRGFYYATSGHGCCYCRGGSGINVYTAMHALGPYSSTSYDIGCAPSPSGKVNIQTCNSSVGAQQNSIFNVQTSSGTSQIWVGDRWQSAPDHLKSHDFQYWVLLRWDDTVVPARLHHLSWVDNFTIDTYTTPTFV